jgi:hypothetical protein
MAGRTFGIKTAAYFFPKLRIMQINTCWKDNSKYFPMSMALFSGTEYTGCGNQIKLTVISIYFQIEPFLNKGIYGYVLFLSKQVLGVQESYMYPFRSSLFGGC